MNEELFDLLGGGGMGMGGGGGGFFSQMFGGAGGGRRRPRKGESTTQPLNVSLEDLYNGKTSKLQLTKKCLCSACNGRGGKPGAVQNCDNCRGSGTVFITRQIRPGMIQQMAARCENCDGEGEIINEKDKCRTCNGKKTVQEQKVIEVKITPGMRDNQKIVFYGEGDQEPDLEPGDVILVLRTKPHDLFKRKGDDLFIQKKITINEALCGFTTVIKHLDGRNIVLSSNPGEVIQPESIRGVIGEGMPTPNGNSKGNLYIVFDVEFPSNHFADEKDLKKIEDLLPQPKSEVKQVNSDDLEEVTLSEYDPRRYASGGGGNREAYQDDEDSDNGDFVGPGGAQHVQCAQQ